MVSDLDFEKALIEIDKLLERVDVLSNVVNDLLPIVDYYHDNQILYTESPYKNWNSIINNARKISNETNTDI